MTTATLGQEIDDLNDVRENIRSITKELKKLEEDKSIREQRIMGLLAEMGLDKASGHTATASISEFTVGSIQDRKKFFRFVKQHDCPELYESRIANVAYREWLEKRKGKPIPGSTTFKQRRLNLRIRGDQE